jgi:hypothetical protein
MPKNKIQDLRNHLFETLEMLKDGDIEIDRAIAIADVSRAIIDTAKVEIQYIKAIESNQKSLFLDQPGGV